MRKLRNLRKKDAPVEEEAFEDEEKTEEIKVMQNLFDLKKTGTFYK